MDFSVSNFRPELYQLIKDEIWLELKQVEGAEESLERLDGRLADFINSWLKKAFIDGHAHGAAAAIKVVPNTAEFAFDAVADAIYAERAFLAWKRGE